MDYPKGEIMEWKEVATGIVVVNNIGDGAQYIKDIEKFVTQEVLSWVPHDQKHLKEDLNGSISSIDPARVTVPDSGMSSYVLGIYLPS